MNSNMNEQPQELNEEGRETLIDEQYIALHFTKDVWDSLQNGAHIVITCNDKSLLNFPLERQYKQERQLSGLRAVKEAYKKLIEDGHRTTLSYLKIDDDQSVEEVHEEFFNMIEQLVILNNLRGYVLGRIGCEAMRSSGQEYLAKVHEAQGAIYDAGLDIPYEQLEESEGGDE